MNASDQYSRTAPDPESPEAIDPSIAESELWREIGDWLLEAGASITERIRRLLRKDQH